MRLPSVFTLLWCVALTCAVGNSRLARADDTTPYRQYTAADGLTDVSVRSLAQTTNGLLWLGTSSGVTVYDGQSFRDVPLPDSLQDRPVPSLHPMPDGSVWATPIEAGAVRVSPQGAIASFLPGTTVHRVLQRGETLLFVTNRAFWSLPPGAERPQRHPFLYGIRAPAQRSSFPNSGRGAVDADVGPDENLWILDGDLGPGRVRDDGSVAFFDVPQSEREQKYWEMRFAPSGDLLFSRKGTLYRLDPGTEQIHRVRTGLDGPIYVNRSQATVTVSWRHHVAAYVASDARKGPLRQLLRTQPGTPDLTPYVTMHDREGGLWIGSRTGLVHLPQPDVRHLRSVDRHSITYPGHFMDAGTTLWLRTWGSGMIQLLPERRVHLPDGHTHWSQKIIGLDGRRYARSRNGLYRGSNEADWERLRSVPHAVRGFVGPDGDGYFWHDDGLFRHALTPGVAPVQLAAWDPETRDRNMVALTPDTSLIVRHEGVILRRRRTDGAPLDTLARIPTYADAEGRYMVADADGALWMAFYRAGLVRVRPGHSPDVERVLDRSMENVRIVGDSLVLASTTDGLFLLDRQTGRVHRHLTDTDGLMTNRVMAAHLSADTLYVAHSRGVTMYPRDRLAEAPTSPATLLTELEVNLQRRSLTQDSVFAADERSIGLAFAGMSLTYSDALRYEYRLLPQDTTWSTTRRTSTRYVNLAPGSYRFQVRACLDRAAPGEASTYAFVIPPYFYETWWFRLLCGVGLIGAVAFGVWWREERLRRQQHVLERAVADRTHELAEEKRKTEAQARRLERLDNAKNRFLAHISHEFRTPLTLILSPIRDAIRNASGEDLRLPRRHARHILHNAERLQCLIQQLLDLATLEAEGATVERRHGDLGAFVRRVTEAFASFADQEGITLELQTPDDPLPTAFDPDTVETVLSNLLSNALKFTPPGGRVDVRLRATEDTVVLAVADTGPGIAPKLHKRIFDRFTHIDAPGMPAYEGIGLGLALSRELVEQHGGHIDVDSAPGDGATFTVRLPYEPNRDVPPLQGASSPLDRCSGEAASDAPDEAEEGGDGVLETDAEGATVLVVEDNAEMRAYLRDQLSEQWTVRTAPDGEAGWTTLQEQPPDLVVSDVMMPHLDGLSLCERIKTHEVHSSIPVVLLTARASDEDTLAGLDQGADDYIVKPFDVRELKQRIANHLAAREHLRKQYQQEVRIEPTGAVADEDDVPFLETVLATVDRHIDDPDFTVDHLADAVALSRRQLSRRLKETVGETPAAFIRSQRMEHAQTLLIDDGPGTIAEVGYRVGFRSASHFSKTFRKVVGCSPSKYRDQNEASAS